MIRPLAPADTARLQRLWLDTFSQAHPSLSLSHWRARLIDLDECCAARTVLVYATRGLSRPDGMIAVSADGHLACLFVARAIQGRGAGSALLAQVLEEQPALSVCVLEENLGARYFFQRHGFTEQGRSFCSVARQHQLLMHRKREEVAWIRRSA